MCISAIFNGGFMVNCKKKSMQKRRRIFCVFNFAPMTGQPQMKTANQTIITQMKTANQTIITQV